MNDNKNLLYSKNYIIIWINFSDAKDAKNCLHVPNGISILLVNVYGSLLRKLKKRRMTIRKFVVILQN